MNEVQTLLGLFGNAFIQTTGGSALILGILLLLIIAYVAYRYNFHITTTYFFAFLIMTVLKVYFNDAIALNDIGLFGTLYNLMLLGLAIVLGSILISGWNR